MTDSFDISERAFASDAPRSEDRPVTHRSSPTHAAANGASGCGVGARLPRKEDDRFLRGRGRYVGDIKLPGMRDVAFVRSPLAHAALRGLAIPDQHRRQVFAAADLGDIKAIEAIVGLPGYKRSLQPILASGKLRHVGEPIAACVADSRAEAEDIAESVVADLDELSVVHDMLEARLPGSPRVHEHWADNVFVETRIVAGDMRRAAARATVHVSREIRTARQCISPLEGRGAVAYFDSREDQLVVWTSTQVPHLIRVGLSESLGLPQGRIRVIAPDVGGGFGYKCVLVPEEVCLAWLALHLRHPVRWVEDRREQLSGGANCREHHYRITAHADAHGRILGLQVEASVDCGAYSLYPFSACLECGQLPGMMPGPYRLEALDAVSYGVATNKPPIVPYRGVARPGACLALEMVVDAVAENVGREAHEVRLENAVPPGAMPYDNLIGKHFDAGDYTTCIRRAAEAIGVDKVRARPPRDDDGRLHGVGFAFFNEQGAVGTAVYAKWGMPFTPGFEQANVRLSPDGLLEVRVGIQSHGQGLETSLAQIAYQVLGIDVRDVKIVHGDTALTPFSTGTWGSRSMVMAGGAVAAACEELAQRLIAIGAHAMHCRRDDVAVERGAVVGRGRSMTIADAAHLWYATPQDLPPDMNTAGLEVTAGYKPLRDSGTFSYAAHAAHVAVDAETGHVEILDYVVVEDGGTLVNPLIVEGQVYGGTAQGIGTGLYEEMPFNDQAQPLASTLLDYVLPGALEIPPIRIIHMETPSPNTRFGIKGIGEGGAIGPPAAILNAVNDALRSLGARVMECPVTPRRIAAAIAAATNRSKPADVLEAVQ
ncbi:MAG TPA: xanthine dehydrogenase family protein molybdopterin-binding subunit [Casimicrobiaceae bacterium]|nr:xanthine dehydrogenase family protein molybdopterin-binding subunit [Casimicrobiaceae bacterium]